MPFTFKIFNDKKKSEPRIHTATVSIAVESIPLPRDAASPLPRFSKRVVLKDITNTCKR